MKQIAPLPDYPKQEEVLGQTDPTSPEFVGVYTPPPAYTDDKPKPMDCLTFPDGRRMTSAEIRAVRAALPRTVSMPYPPGTDYENFPGRQPANPAAVQQANCYSARLTPEEIMELDFLSDDEHVRIRRILTGKD